MQKEKIMDFLGYVLPTEGVYCISSLDRGVMRNYFFNSIDKAAERAVELDKEDRHVYFACATFKSDLCRKANNALYFNSFWLDLDCGFKDADKTKMRDYLAQADALIALKEFCRTSGLPAPTLVSSGHGIQAYWVIDRQITYDTWYPVASNLRAMCVSQEFKIDTSVMADGARIMRLPETRNFRFPEDPKPTSVLRYASPISFEDFKSKITQENVLPFKKTTHTMDALTRSLAGSKEFSFAKILDKSMSGNGCAHIARCKSFPNEINQTCWRNALSIAAFCEDSDKAIHSISVGCDTYDPADTEMMAERLRSEAAPHTCVEFNKNHPGLCDSCSFRTKIKSPISIGSYIAPATPTDNIVTATHAGLGTTVTEIIPELAYPYFRGKNGGVFKYKLPSEKREGSAEEGGEETTEMVYANDLYIVNRLIDPELGETVLVKHHLPRDGIIEFTVPLADVMAPDKCRGALAEKGVAATPSKSKEIAAYIIKSVQQMQSDKPADIARSQFGWHDNDDAFIVGSRQIARDGITYSPPCNGTVGECPKYVRKGDLERWKDIVNVYAAPGNEPRAFALGVGFGAPLVKFTHHSGFIVHLMNHGSGQGKTSVLYLINSIWGHPKTPTISVGDTGNSKQHRWGVLQHLPVTIDELTNMQPEDISSLAFLATQGRGPERMKSSSNSLRKNETSWQTACITSGNVSLHEMLSKNKAFPEGEEMRVLEFFIPKDESIGKEQADILFGKQLYENYGLACEPYMNYILNNLSTVEKMLLANQKRLDKKIGFKEKHRYYSAAVAISLTGLEIAGIVGLHSINLAKVEAWVVDMLSSQREEKESAVLTAEEHLGAFISEHMNNTLVVNVDLLNGLQQHPTMLPRGELAQRYEPDKKRLFIDTVVFRNWCTSRFLSHKWMIESLEATGVLIGKQPKRMLTGTGVMGPAVRCLVFDATVFTGEEIIAPFMENGNANK